MAGKKISQLASTSVKEDANVPVELNGANYKYNLDNLAEQSALDTTDENVTNLTTRVTAIEGAYVDKTTAQTISGLKTFSNGFKIGSSLLAYDTTNECITITFE